MKPTTFLLISVILSLIVFSSDVFSQGIGLPKISPDSYKPRLPFLEKSKDSKSRNEHFNIQQSTNWTPFQEWEHGCSMWQPDYIDDSLVVSAGASCASLNNLKTKRLVRNFFDIPNPIVNINVSKDKRTLLTCTQDFIDIYSIDDSSPISYIYRSSIDSFFTHAEFSPNGSDIIVSTVLGEIIIFKINSIFPLNRKKVHNGVCNWVTYSSDGTKIATAGSDNKIVILDANTLEVVNTFDNFTTPISTVRFSNNSQLLAAGGDDNYLHLFNCNNFTLDAQVYVRNTTINSIDFSFDDNFIVVAGFGGPLNLIDYQTKEVSSISLGRYSMMGARFNNNASKILVSSNNGALREINSNFQSPNSINISATSSTVGEMRYSQNDTFLFSSADWLTKTINTNTGNFITGFVYHGAPIYDFDVSQTGEIHCTGGADGTLILRRAFEDPIELNAHQTSIWSVDLSPDGKKAISSDANGTVIIWNMENTTEKYRFSLSDKGVFDVELSPDNQFFAVASVDKTTSIYEFETGNLVYSYTSEYFPRKVQWSSSGLNLYMLDNYAIFHKIDVANKQANQIYEHNFSVYNFQVTPSEDKLLFHDFDEVYLYNLPFNSVETQYRLSSSQQNFLSFRISAFNTNSTKLAAYSNYGTLHFFSLEKWITSVSTTPMFQAEAFPNPAQYKIDVVFNKALVNPTYSMYNADGSKVEFSIISQFDDKVSFNVANLPNGTYYVQAVEGNTQIRSKFIILR